MEMLTKFHDKFIETTGANANIRKMKKRIGNEAMKSRAFKRGFVDGFTAPFAFFVPRTLKIDRYVITVGSAWDDVGDAVRQSMRDEGIIIDENTATPRRQHTKRPQAA